MFLNFLISKSRYAQEVKSRLIEIYTLLAWLGRWINWLKENKQKSFYSIVNFIHNFVQKVHLAFLVITSWYWLIIIFMLGFISNMHLGSCHDYSCFGQYHGRGPYYRFSMERIMFKEIEVIVLCNLEVCFDWNENHTI